MFTLRSIFVLAICFAQNAAAQIETCVQIGTQCQKPSRQSLFVRSAADLAALGEIAKAPWITQVTITGSDDFTEVIDLSFVSQLPQLEELSLENLGPFDAGDIKSTTLRSLRLKDSLPFDYNFAASLSELRALRLNNALDAFADLPLESIKGLTELVLINSEIASIEGIETFENLNRITLTRTAVDDLAPLASLSLTSVVLVSDKIEDLSPLGASTEMTHLHIGGSSITSLKGLSLGPSFVHIQGSGSALSDISALKTAINVERALFENANITDIEALSGKSQLQHLDLRSNPIIDLSPLGSGSFPNLTRLALSDTLVVDLSPLQNLISVKELGLSRLPAHDLKPLAGMVSVEALWLNETSASDLSPILDMPALQAFIVDDQKMLTKESLPAYMETR